MAEAVNPLSETDLAQINDGINQAEQGMRQLELAKRAGIDVTAQEAELTKTLKQLRQLKQVYFPNR